MVEGYFDNTLQEILVSHAVSSFKVLRRVIGDEDGFIRVICRLTNGDIFEFAEYVQIHTSKINIVTYSFHWQSANGKLIKRWDNVPHHNEVDTYPHHLHLSSGKVIGSTAMNLNKVLKEIEKIIPIDE
jgi:hypothetical protein